MAELGDVAADAGDAIAGEVGGLNTLDMAMCHNREPIPETSPELVLFFFAFFGVPFVFHKPGKTCIFCWGLIPAKERIPSKEHRCA